jgi:hypothetical protein
MRAGFLLALLLAAAGYTWHAFTELAWLSSAGRLGPGFFPRIIGGGLVALCAASLLLDARRAGADGAAAHWRTAALFALLCAAFVALLTVLGGLLAMIAFMAAALWLLNPGRALQNAALALVLPLGVHLLFAVWLKAGVPRGMLGLPF